MLYHYFLFFFFISSIQKTEWGYGSGITNGHFFKKNSFSSGIAFYYVSFSRCGQRWERRKEDRGNEILQGSYFICKLLLTINRNDHNTLKPRKGIMSAEYQFTLELSEHGIKVWKTFSKVGTNASRKVR